MNGTFVCTFNSSIGGSNGGCKSIVVGGVVWNQNAAVHSESRLLLMRDSGISIGVSRAKSPKSFSTVEALFIKTSGYSTSDQKKLQL